MLTRGGPAGALASQSRLIGRRTVPIVFVMSSGWTARVGVENVRHDHLGRLRVHDDSLFVGKSFH